MEKKNLTSRETRTLSQGADIIDIQRPLRETSGTHFPLITTKASGMMTELFASLEREAETSRKKLSPSVDTWKIRSEDLNHYTQISLLDLHTEGRPSVGVLSQTKRRDATTAQIVRIEIDNTSKLSQRSSAYAKFFNVILGIAKDYLTEDGKIREGQGVIVPYDIFVEAGAYANRKNARENFKTQYRQVLEHIKIFVSETTTGKTNEEIEGGGWLFTWADWYSSYAEITLNTKLNYSSLLRYYANMPLECLRASDKAFFLLQLMYSQARKNTAEVKRTGGITLSGKNIARALGLPPLEGNREPGKTFVAPLEKAIEEAEKLAKEQADKEGLKLPKWQFLPSWNEETSAREIEERGTLFVKFNGKEFENITQIADNQAKKIKAEAEKAERRKLKQAEAKGKEEARIEAKEKAKTKQKGKPNDDKTTNR
jgi:hypothetical protein